jgi:hypothetical protein
METNWCFGFVMALHFFDVLLIKYDHESKTLGQKSQWMFKLHYMIFKNYELEAQPSSGTSLNLKLVLKIF